MPTSLLTFILELLENASPRAAEAVISAAANGAPSDDDDMAMASMSEAMPSGTEGSSEMMTPSEAGGGGEMMSSETGGETTSESGGGSESTTGESGSETGTMSSEGAGEPALPDLPTEAMANLDSVWEIVPPEGYSSDSAGGSESGEMPGASEMSEGAMMPEVAVMSEGAAMSESADMSEGARMAEGNVMSEGPGMSGETSSEHMGEFDEATGLPMIAVEMRTCVGGIENDDDFDDLVA